MEDKVLDKEEEYFARQEFERLKKIQEEREKKIAENERKELREFHHMRCPKCGMQLTEIDHQGIKIDKCFSCHGVWLDEGELEAVTNVKKSALKGFLKAFGK